MLFNSIDYLIFLVAVSATFFLTPHSWRWLLLLAASYFFYMSWNAAYLVLILASTSIDYLVGLCLPRIARQHRRWLLLTSLSANLGLLFVFKYWNFFNGSARTASEFFGLRWSVPDIDVLLPVGISFYTFQTLSYTFDVYRNEIRPERHLGRFALYVALFPQLVAGPIERARHLLPQLKNSATLDWARVVSGVQLVLWGLFKKVVIADWLAIYVDAVYGNVGAHEPATYLLATYAFAFQIYCDFSGYSDIAIGSARILGLDLMENFRRPYFSTSITEFWRRWHISLSTWLRDYLYIPLGGNRRGIGRTYANLLITMVLGGLWHGASWNFVIWGALHGGLLALSRVTLQVRDRIYCRMRIGPALKNAFRIIITFHLVCIGWVFFRAETLSDATTILTGFLGPFGRPMLRPDVLGHAALGLVVLLMVEVWQEKRRPVRWTSLPISALVRAGLLYGLLLSIVLFGVETGSQFIYFQF